MYTITAKIPDELYARLENLSQISDRKKSYLIKKAVEEFLEEKEDYFIALNRLEQKNPRYSSDQLEKADELED